MGNIDRYSSKGTRQKIQCKGRGRNIVSLLDDSEDLGRGVERRSAAPIRLRSGCIHSKHLMIRILQETAQGNGEEPQATKLTEAPTNLETLRRALVAPTTAAPVLLPVVDPLA